MTDKWPTAVIDRLWHGVILIDGHGQIVVANASARRILRVSDELGERDGFLFAKSPIDNAKLAMLLRQILGRRDRESDGGTITFPRKGKHATPMSLSVKSVIMEQCDFDFRHGAVLVRVVDPKADVRIDPVLISSFLGLTPAQGLVAALLAEGHSVAEIAASTNRKESSVRSLIKQIYPRLEVTRQVDLVRMVLTVASG